MYILKRGKIASQTGDLGSWLVNTGYRAELVRRKIQKVNAVDRLVLAEKHSKIKEDSVTLVETFHPALYIIFEISSSDYRKVTNTKSYSTKATTCNIP